MGHQNNAEPNPQRFQTAKLTLVIDRFMNHFIKVGGVGVITIVIGIFFFILAQVIPLFQGAETAPLSTTTIEEHEYRVFGMDEYSELPFTVDASGELVFHDVTDGGRGSFTIDPEFEEEKTFTAFNYKQQDQEIVYATDDGHISFVEVDYEPEFQGDTRILIPQATAGSFLQVGAADRPIRSVVHSKGGERHLVITIHEEEGASSLHASVLVQEMSLFGVGEIAVGTSVNLTDQIESAPVFLAAGHDAGSFCVSDATGTIYYFNVDDEDNFTLRQAFRPFEDQDDPTCSSMDFLLGDVSLIFTNPAGLTRVFSLYVAPGANQRLFGQTKEFPGLSASADVFARSMRNKTCLLAAGSEVMLRHATTESLRWSTTLDFTPTHALISSKYDRVAFLGDDSKIHLFTLDDPHPESSLKALFGKVWYEGYPEPAYEWQSTGGTDEFEPKLSMVPLIFGTLKGTFYAMLFAVPIAIAAALYTSQFATPGMRVVIKPVMEIMATLPSVVLGFLAALWLAPLIENRIPSLLVCAIVIPAFAMVVGYGISRMPIRYRALVKPGYEFLLFVPLFVLVGMICWKLGIGLEKLLFAVTDPATGERVADFRLWWPEFTGADYQQRNSLIVGFAMGFAVIPIIFTIAEDSLSNVPVALRSGSMALGASRWQTAIRIVLPTASAGIFSALMIGLGRAVGETMIMVMATGNTPIMDLNIFNGMRTLSANIAVELPEAPQHGTLYRTLFLGGLVLFILTFFINTIAEILRHRLRDRFKTI